MFPRLSEPCQPLELKLGLTGHGQLNHRGVDLLGRSRFLQSFPRNVRLTSLRIIFPD